MSRIDPFETRIDLANDRLLALQQQAAAALNLDTQPLFVAALGDLSTALEELHVVAEELNERNAELLATRAELEAERQHYHDLFEFAPDGYLVTSPDAVIREANWAVAELLGIGTDFLAGKPLILYIAEPDRPLFHANLAQLKISQIPCRWEMVIRSRHGQAHPVAVQAAANRDAHGQVSQLRWMIQDITERKQVEVALRQSQKNDSLGVLAGGAAHDFNNLLVVVLAQTSLALEQLPADSPARLRLSRVLTAAEAAAQLAQQMLAYSGHAALPMKLVDLTKLIEDYHDLLDAALPPKTIRLVTNLATDLPKIQADPVQLQQLMLNLMLNSAEAFGVHGGTITIATGMTRIAAIDSRWWQYTGQPLPPGDYVALTISDTGRGIEPGTLDKIFDPFYSTKFAGRGLGLPVSLGIVRAHRGGLQIDTLVDHGTTVRVALPLAISLTESDVTPAHEPAATPAGRYQVLIIDDEASVREAVQEVLETMGIQTYIAHTGEVGVALYQLYHTDIGLIILDLTMPNLSGAETLQRLRIIDPEAPILLSSGYDEQQALERIKSAPTLGFLRKPYTADNLRSIVSRHLV